MTADAMAGPLGRHGTRLLVTGFGPFPGIVENATMKLVPAFVAAVPDVLPGVAVRHHILDTEWATAPDRAQAAIAAFAPDVILHFGVAASARGFQIERQAHNRCVTVQDAAGCMPAAERLADTGADTLPVGLPVEAIVARLRGLGIPAEPSEDAGGYLCNAVLYRSLSLLRNAPHVRAGFIHVPSAFAMPGVDSHSLLTWTQALTGALEIAAACLDRRVAAAVPATP